MRDDSSAQCKRQGPWLACTLSTTSAPSIQARWCFGPPATGPAASGPAMNGLAMSGPATTVPAAIGPEATDTAVIGPETNVNSNNVDKFCPFDILKEDPLHVRMNDGRRRQGLLFLRPHPTGCWHDVAVHGVIPTRLPSRFPPNDSIFVLNRV